MNNEQNQKNLILYAKRTRLKKNRDRTGQGIARRLRIASEQIIRKLAYSLLRNWYRNKPLLTPIPLAQIQSILIIPYGDAIGDLIVASPIWTAIKSRNSGCKVGVFVSERNASLVRDNPHIDDTYFYRGRQDILNLSGVKAAKRKRYDLILNLHFTHQTDYGFLVNYIGISAIKVTADHPRRALYETFFNLIGRRPRHTTAISHLSLELLSESVDFSPPLKLAEAWPSLTIPVDRAGKIDSRLRELNLAGSKLLVLNLQAATAFREWGIENSLSFADAFLKQFPIFNVILISGPLQQEELEIAVGTHGSNKIKFFKTGSDLLEVAALIARADLVVTPETAITHFASATKTPVIVLLPEREHLPVEWLPVGIPARLIAPHAGQSVATIRVEDVLNLAISIIRDHWTATQTSLQEEEAPHSMFQSVNGNRLLREFASEVLSPT